MYRKKANKKTFKVSPRSSENDHNAALSYLLLSYSRYLHATLKYSNPRVSALLVFVVLYEVVIFVLFGLFEFRIFFVTILNRYIYLLYLMFFKSNNENNHTPSYNPPILTFNLSLEPSLKGLFSSYGLICLPDSAINDCCYS